MGDSFTKEAYQIIYKHPNWKTEAEKYEEQLAARLFHNSYTKNAVKTALTKISRILTAYYGTEGKSLTEQEQQTVEAAGAITDLGEQDLGMSDGNIRVNKTLVRALMQGRRDNTGAGQVKKLVEGDTKADGSTYTAEEAEQENLQTLDAVMNRDGNLREQMTLLYNGMFINGGSKKADIQRGVSFKGVLQGVKRPGAEAANSPLSEINYDLLEGMAQYKDGNDIFDTYHLARDMERRNEELQGKGNWLTRWWRGIKRAWSAAFSNNFKRSKRSNGQGLGLEHYRRLNIAPSERESAFAIETDAEGRQQLRWKEGTAYYKPNDEVTAEGMLQTAGTSGTTLRMLGAYRLMGASDKELLDFRLALIAWMISSHDHSLFEILEGSHNAGVKGTEDISEAANMYMNIDPLDTDILRDHFAKDKQFPHEIIFKQKLNELRDAREAKALELVAGRKNALATRQATREIAQAMEELYNAKVQEQRMIYSKISRLQGMLRNSRKAYANDTDGSKRAADENELRERQEQVAELEETIQTIRESLDQARQNVKARDKEAPDKLFYSTNAVLNDTDATKLNAHNLALNIYTTGAYLSINRGFKKGITISKWALKGKDAERAKFGTYEGSYIKETKDDELLAQIHDMVRISARMAQEAMEERGAHDAVDANEPSYMHVSTIDTFRGEQSSGSGYKTVDSIYETKSFTSSSKSLDKAVMYFGKSVQKVGYNNSVLAIYKMNGKGTVDVSRLSKVPEEQEVLIAPGSGFKVEKALVKNVSLDALRGNTNQFVSDPNVTDEQLAEEFQETNGKINPSRIRHVNVVRLVEHYGPSEKRRERYAGREETKQQIVQSLRTNTRGNRRRQNGRQN